jgi:hypothetical protein
VGVTDGLNIRAHAVDQQVHADFAGHDAAAGDALALEVNDDHIGRAHGAFAHASWSYQDAIAAKADRKIAVTGGHESPLVEHSSVVDDLFPMFALGRHGYPLGGSLRKAGRTLAKA